MLSRVMEAKSVSVPFDLLIERAIYSLCGEESTELAVELINMVSSSDSSRDRGVTWKERELGRGLIPISALVNDFNRCLNLSFVITVREVPVLSCIIVVP